MLNWLRELVVGKGRRPVIKIGPKASVTSEKVEPDKTSWTTSEAKNDVLYRNHISPLDKQLNRRNALLSQGLWRLRLPAFEPMILIGKPYNT